MLKYRNIVFLLLMMPFALASQDAGLTDGYHQFFYPNGVISSEGYIRDGKPDGYWISYYVTGVKKSEGKRTSFLLDSTWVFYDNAGDTLEKITYLLGRKNGYSFQYRKDAYYGLYVYIQELFAGDQKEGLAYVYYPDGSVKQTIPYNQGKKEGLSKEYDREGNIITLYEYSNDFMINRQLINRTDNSGLKQGEWRDFHDNGAVSREMTYKDDLLHGFYREFNRMGHLIASMLYENGRLIEGETGESSDIEIVNRYNDDGQLIYSGPYRNDIPVGIHREYDNDGDILNAKIYSDKGVMLSEGIIDIEGNRNGGWKDFYEDESLKAEGQYTANRRSGNWSFYNRSGRVIQTGVYNNGRVDGLWRWYYDDGSVLREEEYYLGLRDGLYTEYSIEGEIIATGEYADGERNGFWRFSAGDITEEGNYIFGLRDGMWRAYYNDGQIRFRGSYVQGNPDGIHLIYHSNGRLMEERYYQNGLKERTWKRFTEEGIQIIAVSYRRDTETAINGVRIRATEGGVRIIR